jgi:hypothetical protein
LHPTTPLLEMPRCASQHFCPPDFGNGSFSTELVWTKRLVEICYASNSDRIYALRRIVAKRQKQPFRGSPGAL